MYYDDNSFVRLDNRFLTKLPLEFLIDFNRRFWLLGFLHLSDNFKFCIFCVRYLSTLCPSSSSPTRLTSRVTQSVHLNFCLRLLGPSPARFGSLTSSMRAAWPSHQHSPETNGRAYICFSAFLLGIHSTKRDKSVPIVYSYLGILRYSLKK